MNRRAAADNAHPGNSDTHHRLRRVRIKRGRPLMVIMMDWRRRLMCDDQKEPWLNLLALTTVILAVGLVGIVTFINGFLLFLPA